MIVVSNASAIINLAAIGHLDLLRQLYDKIITRAGFWVSDQLYAQVLQVVGE